MRVSKKNKVIPFFESHHLFMLYFRLIFIMADVKRKLIFEKENFLSKPDILKYIHKLDFSHFLHQPAPTKRILVKVPEILHWPVGTGFFGKSQATKMALKGRLLPFTHPQHFSIKINPCNAFHNSCHFLEVVKNYATYCASPKNINLVFIVRVISFNFIFEYYIF